MDPHYYHLKKLCRKKGAPIFAYKIDAQEFIKDEENVGLLREALNIESGHELMETSYILINEEKMKLPQPRGAADPAISFKFIQNPEQVSSVDDLYDLFDLHRNEPHKFICMLKNGASEPKNFTLQNKLFRKFFYENSAPAEDLLTFVEVTSPRLAVKLGLTGTDQIIVVQNTNRYSSLPVPFKLVNLEMERTEPFKELLQVELENKLSKDFFEELTPNEVVEQLIHGDNEQINCYQKFCSLMQSTLLPVEDSEEIIFAPTTKALRFYRSYFRKELADVLFVGVNDPVDPDSLIQAFSNDKLEVKLEETKSDDAFVEGAFDKYKRAQELSLVDLISSLKQLKRDSASTFGKDVHVLFSDVKEAPAHMSLIQDQSSAEQLGEKEPGMAQLLNPTIRLLRYGHLFNERTGTMIRMSDVLQSQQLQQELNSEADFVFALKYRPTQAQLQANDPMQNFVKECLLAESLSDMPPHLESTPIAEKVETDSDKKPDEGYDGTPIKQLNRENFKSVLDGNQISVIAVFAKRCPACRELEPKLPQLQRMLEEEVGTKNVGVCTIDIHNETHFLKQVDKTPSFLLHEKKGNFFWDLSTWDFEEIVKTVDRIHKKSYRL